MSNIAGMRSWFGLIHVLFREIIYEKGVKKGKYYSHLSNVEMVLILVGQGSNFCFFAQNDY